MKTSISCLQKMAENAMWAEHSYLKLGMFEQAAKYGKIWLRICKTINNQLSRNLDEFRREWA